MLYETIAFESEGATLRGRLYLPAGEQTCPAVVMAHGTSATITMCIDRYAERFAAVGIAALLFDHRNFGISDGEPRQQINPWLQARGYRHALDKLESVPRVDAARLGAWGDSYTGGIVLVVAACDERVRCIVAQCPACGPSLPMADPDGARFARMRQVLQSGDITGTPATTVGPMPVVSFDQAGAPSLLKPISAFRWFIEYGGRHGSGWLNNATRTLPPVSEPFHPGIAAPFVTVASLALIAPDDEMEGANPAVARAAFASTAGETEIVDIAGGHFGILFESSAEFAASSEHQSQFLRSHL